MFQFAQNAMYNGSFHVTRYMIVLQNNGTITVVTREWFSANNKK